MYHGSSRFNATLKEGFVLRSAMKYFLVGVGIKTYLAYPRKLAMSQLNEGL